MKTRFSIVLIALAALGLCGCAEVSPYPGTAAPSRGAGPVGYPDQDGGVPSLRMRTPVFSPDNRGGQAGAPGRLTISPPPPAASAPSPAPRRTESPAAAPQVSLPEAVGSGYVLRPLDPIIVNLTGIPDPILERQLAIDASGFINLPYIGAVQAAGITTSQLEKRIEARYLESKIYRQITVNVLLPAQAYFMQGEVRKPGKFPLVSGMTLMQAIASAGGYTEFANPKKVKVIRGDNIIEFNLIQLQRNPNQDVPIEAGDVIQVDRSFF